MNKTFSQKMEREVLSLESGGTCFILRNFLSPMVATRLFETLQTSMPWSKSELMMYGKKCLTPRFQCWMGDEDVAAEVYSNTRVAWTEDVWTLKQRVEKDLSFSFNYLLLNFYKTGDDYIGFHSDMEVLSPTDLIASLSLGGTRRFLIRNKADKKVIETFLNSGDLMVMDGLMQQTYKHSVPKTKKPVAGRINLTFRRAKRQKQFTKRPEPPSTLERQARLEAEQR